MIANGGAARVSVVVPTRNRQELLVTAVASILQQSLSDLEVWVIDDGSDPPVDLETLMPARDQRVHLVRLDPPMGAAAARNKGVERATAPYLAFLDDDDEWFPDKLQEQLTALSEADDRTGAVFSGYEAWDESGLLYTYIPRVEEDLTIALLKEPVTGPPMVLMRTEMFRALGGFDVSLERYEDWDLWLRLVQARSIKPLPRVDVRIRLHESLSPRDRLRHHLDMYRRVRPYVALRPLPTRIAVHWWHTRRTIVRLLELFVSSLHPGLWKKLRRWKGRTGTKRRPAS